MDQAKKTSLITSLQSDVYNIATMRVGWWQKCYTLLVIVFIDIPLCSGERLRITRDSELKRIFCLIFREGFNKNKHFYVLNFP